MLSGIYCFLIIVWVHILLDIWVIEKAITCFVCTHDIDRFGLLAFTRHVEMFCKHVAKFSLDIMKSRG